MSTPQRTRLTNNQKLTLIEESQQPGFKVEDATAKYSLSKAAVYRIIQNKDKFVSNPLTSQGKELKNIRQPTAPHLELEKRLIDFMVHMGKRGFLMNGDQVIEPAKEVAKELNITDLKFSNGWIRNFKRRNNLKFKKAHGEKQSADFEGAEEWKKTVLPRVLEKIGYNFNLLYNADETGLCYRALPDQGYVIGRYAHLMHMPWNKRFQNESLTI